MILLSLGLPDPQDFYQEYIIDKLEPEIALYFSALAAIVILISLYRAVVK